MADFEGVRSIQAWTPIAPEAVPQAARALYARLSACQWQVELFHAVTLRRATFYAASTKTNSKGDPKKAAHGVDHFALRARRDHEGQSVARVLVTWAKERPAEGAKAKPTLFEDAHTWDMICGFEFHKAATGFKEWVEILTRGKNDA